MILLQRFIGVFWSLLTGTDKSETKKEIHMPRASRVYKTYRLELETTLEQKRSRRGKKPDLTEIATAYKHLNALRRGVPSPMFNRT